MKNFIHISVYLFASLYSTICFADTLKLVSSTQNAENISIALHTNSSQLCNWQSDTVEVEIAISNGMTSAPEIIVSSVTSSETLHYSIDAATADALKRPLKKTEHTYYKYSGRFDIHDSSVRDKYADHFTVLRTKATFEIPEEDGVYNETIQVHWQAINDAEGVETVPASTNAKLFYRVKDGCVKFIKAKKYYKEVAASKKIYGEKNGQKILLEDAHGYIEADEEVIPSDKDINGSIWTDEEDSSSESSLATKAATTLDEGIELEFCVRLQFRDGYQGIPTNTYGMAWSRPRGDSALHNFDGVQIEFWDRDWDSSDDYMGYGYLQYTADGTYGCKTFYWNEAVTGEAYPDVYIRTEYRVKAPGSNYHANFCASSTSCNSGVTWRNNYYGDLGKYTTKAYRSYNFGAVDSRLNEIAMIMNGAQKFFSRSSGMHMTHDLNYFVDDNGWIYSWDRQKIQYDQDLAWRWQAPSHEAGHSYHMQLFGQDTLYNSCPDPHYIDTAHNQHCATTEGWAEFVETSSWYDSTATVPINSASPSVLYNMESGSFYSDCATNAKVELTIGRLFWDIYDRHGDSDTPVYDYSFNQLTWNDMALIWKNFPNGTGNTENDEPLLNVRDYHHNAGSLSTTKKNKVGRALSQNDGFCQSWP